MLISVIFVLRFKMPFVDVISKICCIFITNGYETLPLAENGNESAHSTIKPTRRAPIAGNLPTGSSISNNNTYIESEERQRRIAIATAEFREKHELFRMDVMPDIVAYRKSQQQPLIQY